MAIGTDSVDIAITGSVIDSETTTRTVYGNISLAKSKKATPNVEVSVSPQSQTVTANPDGSSPSTPTSLTVRALEGGSTKLTSVTAVGTSVTTGTITNDGASSPYNFATIPLSAVAADNASVAITINYTDSEGTAGTKTLTALISKAKKGTTGDIGADGKRTATGMVFYQLTSATAPTTPAATSYTFSTNAFGSLTTNWAVGAPTYTAGNTNKYWYSTYTAVETTAGGGTAVPTFSAAQQAINFTGLVTFTSTDKITDGTNTSNIVPSGSITNHIGGANVTTINGGKISTGVITSEGYGFVAGTADTVASGSYMADGTIFNLNNGSLRSKNFYISSTGDAVFRGALAAATGTFSGNISAATGTFTGGVSGTGYTLNNSGLSLTNTASSISLGNGVTLSSSGLVGTGFTLNSSGLNLTNTASSISVGNGVTLNSSGLSGTGFSLTTTGVVATAGSIAGWTMDGSGLYKTTGVYTLRLASSAQKISITQASNIDTIDRVIIDASTTIPKVAVPDTGSLYWSNAGQIVVNVTNNSSPTNDSYNTGYVTPNGSPSHAAVSGVYGIIGLIYGEENIFVEAENFPSVQSVITGNPGGEGSSYISGQWDCTIRVRKFPTDTDALNQTNVDVTFGTNGTIEQQLAYREVTEYANYPQYDVDTTEIYGCSIPVTGGGGINSGGPGRWYRVEIIQSWSVDGFLDGETGGFSVSGRRPASDIYVKFGRVNNGYSIFSPGGLQAYVGVRNYLNASTPSGSTGDASNFFLVKGKSQIIGSLNVSSGFSAQFKNFRIQHPLNENKWLYHTSTESPRADLIYRGTLELQGGAGSTSIDSASNMTIGTFDSLIKNPQLFLQNNESFDRIKGYVESGSVYVLSENENSTASIDWSVIAERKDTVMLKSPLYDRNGKYKTESYKGEYLQLPRSERIINITGSV